MAKRIRIEPEGGPRARRPRLRRRDEADPKGPGHSQEPLELTSKLRKTLRDDTSTPNLEKHRPELIGTRDKINLWMQDHPDDYN
ncbi:hypothetical protein [Streptomyces sp. IB2014 016-6]|uniref:hypothetical protein n=1 Tax=Streptomyces sp. IB2014 016-6 TaxID=2517818 RepID=UPI0011CA43D9|nr:hypothetical protein [Streptomyces sp. IB2014 016-6]TXL88807.1 hypothetical protein EW053_16890 [Streptomyces sp. IB2014 016-6]